MYAHNFIPDSSGSSMLQLQPDQQQQLLLLQQQQLHQQQLHQQQHYHPPNQTSPNAIIANVVTATNGTVPALISQPGTQSPALDQHQILHQYHNQQYLEQQRQLQQIHFQQQLLLLQSSQQQPSGVPIIIQQQQQHQQQYPHQQQLLQLNPVQLLQQQQQQNFFPPTLISSSSIILQQVNQQQQQNQQPFVFPNLIPPTPALVRPCYTVQDRPENIIPLYNGVNPMYPGLRVLRTKPAPMFLVDHFLSPEECHLLITVAQDSFQPAPVVGAGSGELSPSRTSSTCYLARDDIPTIMEKVGCITGKPAGHCELPQVGRYLPTQQYLQHYDAFDLSTPDGCRFALNGGQRIITILIYLNTLPKEAGGATRFPALLVKNENHNHSNDGNTNNTTGIATAQQQPMQPLEIQPVQGMALIFFPATIDGYLDQNALHAALPVAPNSSYIKYVSQIWIRQSDYNGTPSKRIPPSLIIPSTTTASTTMPSTVPASTVVAASTTMRQ